MLSGVLNKQYLGFVLFLPELHSLGSHSDQLTSDACELLHGHQHEEIIEHFEVIR